MALTPNVKKQLIEDTCAMIEEMGGVGALHERLEQFQRAADRMFNERETLTEKHPDKWVAMGKDGPLAIGDSLDEVIEEVESQGMRAGEVMIEFLDSDPPVLIL